MLIVTILIRPIMYYRYMLITSGIFLFPFAYFLLNNNTKHQKIISGIVIVMILGLSIIIVLLLKKTIILLMDKKLVILKNNISREI